MRRRLRRIGALVRLALLELWRRNDLFALLVLALALLVPLSLARPFGAAGATRFYDDAALLLVWGYSIFVSLGVGGRLFTSEFANRTVYPLLAKPVSRGELLAGKYLGRRGRRVVVRRWRSSMRCGRSRPLLRGGDEASDALFLPGVRAACDCSRRSRWRRPWRDRSC